MTIYSQRAQTVAENRDVHGEPRLERPVIEEQFWGYEIGPSPVERGALAMSRGDQTPPSFAGPLTR
ncbi:hypothetical protein [Salibaculum griseiflavum]|uniref:Uncharacterized protein n=1 Tax=Salibaculum griseiflavum TaxID=1914409 RepID=A0A2V1P7H1_9RHOB|nr:hypothetical protein [Salibaculum griseiflavum]PWG18286.1 hypothetical protein DFK10_03290 [Salibaculum griseiflavum]